MAKPELVGHDAFYMKELNDMVDIRHDYDLWHARKIFPPVRKNLINQNESISLFTE